ncbi:MAG: RpiB/LacA/LacB family sugar-phosphate isomerase [bacterium]|nr:RpiB/LacA/LacB family sugar-phosphate isomerase [bacterium]
MKIFLGADHRGFELKEKLKEWLTANGHDVHDLGAHRLDPADDYPDFAMAVAEKVAEDPAANRGVLLCGSGTGMDVVANKVRGVRAAIAWSRDAAQHARERDDANVVSLAADWTPPETVREIVLTFIGTDFGRAERDVRRLEKIAAVEERNFK